MINTETEQDFYQIDFTTASEWEIFTARLEEIFCEWNLTYSPIDTGTEQTYDHLNWIVKNEKVVFRDMEFLLTYYHLEREFKLQQDNITKDDKNESEEDFNKIKALEDMMCVHSDFKTAYALEGDNVNRLAQWYGLKDFVVLTPNKYRNISSESKVKLLLSSFCIAAGNVRCEIPIFAQILEAWQNYFTGVCISKGVRAEYQMIHLKKVPPQCRYLSGILNVFKSYIAPSSISLDPVSISVRFSYVFQDWLTFTFMQELLDLKYDENNVLEMQPLRQLIFGTTCEPINELILHATWPELVENIVIDSETYTDLDPVLAPVWSLRMNPAHHSNCALSDYMLEYLEKCCSPCSMKELIGDLYQRNTNEPDLSQSLSLLTETKLPVISKLINEVNVVTKRQNSRGFISDNILVPILYFLFPDADNGNSISYDEAELEGTDNLYMLKSSPVDCLVWRLAILMSHGIHMLGGIRAAANLWYEFTMELRYRWENNVLIPGVKAGNPDHKTCLINQKLQMLNCCIRKRLSRNQPTKQSSVQLETDDTEEEEFYDCQVEYNENKCMEQSPKNAKDASKYSLWNQPVGRLGKYKDMRLINTGEYMYVPVTQEVTPKTEDQLEEDAAILIQMGSDSQGSELRSRLMSASLYSDMESFKAANPGAILDDFIRWYSPRDWIEEEEFDQYGQKKGQLSPRMKLPGNMWKEVWDNSKPVPAARQKRLFDDTKEAEKILYFFESTSPANALRLLFPVFIHIAMSTIITNTNALPLLDLKQKVSSLVKKACNITRSIDFDLSRSQELVGEIACIESIVSRYKSLKYKLFPEESHDFDQDNFVKQLVDGSEVVIPHGPKSELGNRLIIIFSEIQKNKSLEEENKTPESRIGNSYSVFSAPFEKQFVLRVRASRPSPSSRKLPQKLVANVLTDQIIMAGCYSQDTVFL